MNCSTLASFNGNLSVKSFNMAEIAHLFVSGVELVLTDPHGPHWDVDVAEFNIASVLIGSNQNGKNS